MMEETQKNEGGETPQESGNTENSNKSILLIGAAVIIALIVIFFSFGNKSGIENISGNKFVSGAVAAFDEQEKTFTITSSDSEKEMVVNLSRESKIYREFQSGEKTLLEINLKDIEEEDRAEISYGYALNDNLYEVKRITIKDARSFEEYEDVRETPNIFYGSFVELQGGSIVVSLKTEEGGREELAIPLSPVVSVVSVVSRDRAYILHAWKEADFSDVRSGKEIALQVAGGRVATIIVIGEKKSALGF